MVNLSAPKLEDDLDLNLDERPVGFAHRAVLHIVGANSVQYSTFEDYFISLSTSCKKQGISLLLAYPDLPANGGYSRDFKRAGGKSYILPGSETVSFRSGQEIWRMLRALRPQAVHAHFGRIAYISVIFARLLGIPRIFLTKHERIASTETARHKAGYKFIASRADKVFCVSDLVRRDLKSLGISEDKLEILPLGVQAKKFITGAQEKRGLSRELGLSNTETLVLSVAHLRPGKGLETLLEAIPSVLELHRNTTFLLAGEGILRDELRAQVERLKIDHKVRFLGTRQDIARIVSGSDVFISTSFSEGGGSSILEAMAAAKPVISTPVGLAESLITDRENGFFAPIADISGTVRVLADVLNAKDRWAKVGSMARRTVETSMSLDKSTQDLADVYAQSILPLDEKNG